MFNNNDRGQVGIGTLIVFIAMVLVAAIAAGVLINTAGMLQSSAEQTGDDATAQVTDNVQIQSVIAYNDASEVADGSLDSTEDNDAAIVAFSLLLQATPGADAVDLDDAMVEVEADGDVQTLTSGGSTDRGTPLGLGAGEFGTTNINGGDESVLDGSNQIELFFEENNNPNLGELGEDETVSIAIVSPSGAQAFKQVTTPSNIDDGETEQFIL